MADLAQIAQALRAADAAGNEEDARRLAEAYKAAQASQPSAPPPAASKATPRAVEQAPDPSEGGGTLQFATPWKTYDTGIDIGQGTNRFLSGMGSAFAGTVQGIGQLTGQVSQDDVDETRRLEAPLMDTGAGTVGMIGGQVAQMAIPVGGGVRAASYLGRAAPYAAAAARAGGLAALQPMATGQDRATETAKAAAMGAAGQGVAAAGGALARGAVSRLDSASAGLARAAEGYGIKLGLPNLTQNPLARTAMSQMERLPFSGASSRANANQEAMNRAVGETFGADAAKITPDVFSAAKSKLSQVFDTLSSRNNLKLDPSAVTDIGKVLDSAKRLGTVESEKMVKGYIDDLLSRVGPNGEIPGKAYQAFDSDIGQTMKAGGLPAKYLGELRDVIRSTMDKSISDTDRRAWQEVRKRWAAMKTVEPLVAKSATGDISPAALMGRVTSDAAGKIRMASGNSGNLGELARIGQRFMKESPNSGTADRALVNAAVGGGLYGAQQQGWISPETAMYTGGALLGNRVGLSALNSRALSMGEGRTLTGLARLLSQSPKALPSGIAGLVGAPLPLDVVGGTRATPEDIARDAEIVRRFREQQGR